MRFRWLKNLYSEIKDSFNISDEVMVNLKAKALADSAVKQQYPLVLKR